MMRSKMIGGILLIVGTSIGGGMLALPTASASMGFWPSSLLLLGCWVIMTLGAFFILEVALYLPPGKNMISMAGATLGKPGLLMAWLSYLFLLYTLLSAYISGGADVLGGLLQTIHIHTHDWVLVILFTFFFGAVVYMGIRSVDLLNRALMFAKLGVYLILVFLFIPFMRLDHLQGQGTHYPTSAVMIFLTSFGFAIIIPNLREYFNDDIRALKRVIWIGSLIPLFCYLAWNAVIIGTVPSQGEHGLIALMSSSHATSSLAALLSQIVQNQLISRFFNFFTSICMLTAFLGVSLCLLSFLSDGLNLSQQGRQGVGLFFLTFLPPLFIVLYYPGIYLQALAYAGLLVIILLLLLPALMSYFGRKRANPIFIVPGGAFSQWLIIVSSVVLISRLW